MLLDALGIAGVPVVALHSHNETAASEAVLRSLEAGADVALVSDAGTPLLSDPGFELVRACRKSGIEVLPVPGPSSVTAALSVCPLPAHPYRFEGFLPARSGQRQSRLRDLIQSDVATVFFEAPHRMTEVLNELAELAPERQLFIAREMTKRHEQYLCGCAAEVLQALTAGGHLKGEFVCVLEAAPAAAAPLPVRQTMEVLVRAMAPAQAARIGAQLLALPRRELYELAMSLRQE